MSPASREPGDATRLTADVLVVGSGAGGAPTAAILAEAGFDVVVLEEGPLVRQGDVTPFSLEQMDRQYRAGGVTAALILPGSANLIGGRGVVVVMRPGLTIDEVRFPAAPPSVKMACGENPKRVYGQKGGPMTRMAEYAAFRAAFHQAVEYRQKQLDYTKKKREYESKQRAAAESGSLMVSGTPVSPPSRIGL